MASKYILGGYELAVRRSRTGRGLFTLESIPKARCVAEYTGRVISPREEYTSRSKYLFEVTKKITIDGNIQGNLARYINHSCKPNCEIEIYRGHVYVMSKRPIKPEEELTYDYDTEYFNTHIRPKGCKCEACLKKK